MSTNTVINPLLCDPVSGVCEIPDGVSSAGNEPLASVSDTTPVDQIHITYFTDPICSTCWGIEPQLRKLKLEYGRYLTIDYRMGGLLPSWDVYNSGGISKPADVAHHWDEVSQHYQMPIDGDVWLEDPLSSSYPPSVAFIAARYQNPEKAILFLRIIREMVFLHKKNITRWEHLALAASEAGLDVERFRFDYEHRAIAGFEDDLAFAKRMGVRGFPTLFLETNTRQTKIYGFKPYSLFEDELHFLKPDIQKTTIALPTKELFHKFRSLTTQEFAVITEQDFASAGKILSELEKAGSIESVSSKNGFLWLDTL
jgi:putative protein-disulfide isomerase